MAEINKGRMFAKPEGEFVVFLIGMRVNNFLKVHKWFPAAMAMPKMLKELMSNPESGFLGAESWFGRTTIMVQYWKSFEHLEAYAKDSRGEHFPAWVKFNKKLRQSNAAGVWHETYRASGGSYENIYVNMPSFGLGKAVGLREAEGKNSSTEGRIKGIELTVKEIKNKSNK